VGREEGGGFRMGNTCILIKLKKKEKERQVKGNKGNNIL